jgi:hypothetical protein
VLIAFAADSLARAQEPTPPAPAQTPTATAVPEFRLDLIVDNPDEACASVESTREAVPGDEFMVGVCLLNAPEPPAVVSYFVLYDDRVVLAPNVGNCDGDFQKQEDLFDPESPSGIPSIEESLDCNPDANAGRTTFGVRRQ